MNSEKVQKIYNGITGIKEDIVEDAQCFLPKKKVRSWVKWSTFAACLCLAVWGVYGVARLGLVGRMGIAPGISGENGGGDDSTYMSYAGPVFPLSALSGGDNLMVERNVNYDFSPYETLTKSYEANGETRKFESYDPQSIVTDSYMLTNSGKEEQTVTLVYPFAASLSDDLEVIPTITVDGETVQAALHIGPYSGGYEGAYDAGSDFSADVSETLNLAELNSWEKYRALLGMDYQARAFDALPVLTQPAVVYEISDMYGKRSEEATAPTLNMEFTIDYERTTILTFGFNGGTNNRTTGYCARDLFIPPKGSIDYGESAYLIVLGDDIGEYTLNAYVNGACEKKMENAGGTVIRYETTLGEIFAIAVKQYLGHYWSVNFGEDADILSTIPEDIFVGLAAELLCDSGMLSNAPVMRYDTGMLEEMFEDSLYVGRVMYLTFDVTLSAGGGVEAVAQMVKKASTDFRGASKFRNGYDMVTRLGSSLTFTGQTASVSNTQDIEILRQNFGFDLENGVTKVELDLAQEHYYLEIRKVNLSR